MVSAIDPISLTGYNTDNLDYPYLLTRAQVLGIKEKFVFSRIRSYVSQVVRKVKENQQQGKRETCEIIVPGRILFDMLPLVKEEPPKLRSYTLNFVSSHFLKQQKGNVHHSLIPKLQKG